MISKTEKKLRCSVKKKKKKRIVESSIYIEHFSFSSLMENSTIPTFWLYPFVIIHIQQHINNIFTTTHNNTIQQHIYNNTFKQHIKHGQKSGMASTHSRDLFLLLISVCTMSRPSECRCYKRLWFSQDDIEIWCRVWARGEARLEFFPLSWE